MPFEPTRRQTLLGLGALGGALTIAAPALGRPSYSSERGINIPLWFDQDDGSDQPPSAAVLSHLRGTGFNAVRLPLSPQRFAEGDHAVLTKLANSLRQLHNLGFIVTLDLHPLGDFRDALEASAEAEEVLVRAWAALAPMVADQDPHAIHLELLNEPPMWQDRWLPLRDRLATTVRESTAEHLIIWGANRFQRIDETLQTPPLADDNARVAVHYYVPADFTHQCQNWNDMDVGGGELSFPSPDWDVDDIDREFATLAKWSQQNATPVVLNEFGTLGFCSDLVSRATWTRAVRMAAERHGFSWSYWELDRGFGFLDSREQIGEVNHAILDSLIGD